MDAGVVDRKAVAVRATSIVAIVVIAVCGCSANRPLRVPGGKQGGAAAAGSEAPAPPLTGAAGATSPSGDMGPSFEGFAGSAGSADLGAGGAAGLAPPPPGGFAGFGDVGPPPPPPPPSAFCDGMPEKALPYAIGADFPLMFVINSPPSWLVEPGADCGQTVFSDVAPPDAGPADGGVASDAGWSAAPPTGGGAAVTSCMAFRYDPDDCVASQAGLLGPDGGPVDTGAACWAGVIYTPSPGGISAPGICIVPGATAIHFKARASREGARVKFGSIRAGLESTEFFILLTTAWTDYTVSIPAGEDYDGESPVGGVWNGFSVVAEAQDHPGGTYIFVSDVVWAAQ